MEINITNDKNELVASILIKDGNIEDVVLLKGYNFKIGGEVIINEKAKVLENEYKKLEQSQKLISIVD